MFPNFRSVIYCLVGVLPFAYLWLHLINNLRVEWNTNPQYSYGWVVPLLCLGLFIHRYSSGPHQSQSSIAAAKVNNAFVRTSTTSRTSTIVLFAFLAFAYLPTRLLEAATPEWRPIQWSLALQAVGLTLCAVYLAKGVTWLRLAAFPACFFLVAVPWPSLIEQPIIQTLTRANVTTVIELLGWLGVPAAQHGNVIEVSTGVVGIDEACSGIRSFQSSLMISLFFGEFYRLGRLRRWLLVPAGFLLAFAFNVCRTTLLTWVAGEKGVNSISEYHDPAGIAILLACTAGMWAVAFLLNRQKRPLPLAPFPSTLHSALCTLHSGGSPLLAPRPSLPLSGFRFQLSAFSFALLLWLLVSEAGVSLWYVSRESHLVPGPNWSVAFPRDNPAYKDLPISPKTQSLLRFDEGKQAEWKATDGTQWQGFYFSWLPGKTAGYLAKRHTPEICMPAAGRKLRSGPELMLLSVNGLQLPVRGYVFAADQGSIYVFHCRWEAGVKTDDYVKRESGRFNQLRGIWAGRGKHGQKVLEFIITGFDDPEQAKAALIRQLQKLIKVEKPEAGPV